MHSVLSGDAFIPDGRVKPGERVDDLQIRGLKIIQRADRFRFGTDSVLLSNFAVPPPGARVVDLGTGTGVLPLLMYAKQPESSYDAIEIQPEMADMAARSVEMNALSEIIRVHCADLRDAPSLLGHGKYDRVVCNPPYFPSGSAIASQTDAVRIARHEDDCTLSDICRAASALLRNGGRVSMVYPAPRLFELMCEMRAHRLEPKRVRTVHASLDREPKLVLIDAAKGARPLLHWMPPLILDA